MAIEYVRNPYHSDYMESLAQWCKVIDSLPDAIAYVLATDVTEWSGTSEGLKRIIVAPCTDGYEANKVAEHWRTNLKDNGIRQVRILTNPRTKPGEIYMVVSREGIWYPEGYQYWKERKRNS